MPGKRKEIEVVATADFHGILPKIKRADVLVIAGDVFPIAKYLSYKKVLFNQLRFYDEEFLPWLERTLKVVKRIVIVGGNYDYVLQQEMIDFPKGVVYLKDETFEYKGWRFYGFPWSNLKNSTKVAFTLPDSKLELKAAAIPDTDVLVSHAPIYGFGDLNRGGRHKGLPALRAALKRQNIAHMICGHIHNGFGEYLYKSCEIHAVALTECLDSGEYRLRKSRIQRFVLRD